MRLFYREVWFFTVFDHQSSFFFLGVYSTDWFWKGKRRFVSFLGRSSSKKNDVTLREEEDDGADRTRHSWSSGELDSTSCQFGALSSGVFIIRGTSSATYLRNFLSHLNFSPVLVLPRGVFPFTHGHSMFSLTSLPLWPRMDLSQTFRELFSFLDTALHWFHLVIPERFGFL